MITAARALAVLALLVLAGCSAAPAPPPAPPAPAVAPEVTAAPEEPAVASYVFHVDHAWVRDADTPEQQAGQAAAMTALHDKVVAGGAFVATWNGLGVDGSNWHVAEAESYPADVLPTSVQALPDGAVSAVVPGDGGLHLFRILRREAQQ